MAYELSQREACGRCGHRVEDFKDENGDLHDPPHVEAAVEHCPGCERMTLLRLALEDAARRQAGTGEDSGPAMAAALAGQYVVLRPFDPDKPLIAED